MSPAGPAVIYDRTRTTSPPPTDVPWCCPRCRAPLEIWESGARCDGCGRRYGCVGPVLDLRVPGPGDDFSADTAQARHFWARAASAGAEAYVRQVFAARPGWTDRRVAFRTRQVIDGPARYRHELREWLAPVVAGRGPVLDLGCGAGSLLAAASAAGTPAIGVDLSMVWLLAAHLLISEHGGTPVLAAGLAEALPLRDGCLGGVVSLDVIEHVPDIPAYLREISRVTRPGGHVAFSTPNRYSLAPEPHVGLLGVGWLPRRLQGPYVRWRLNDPYESVWLRSARELGALFAAHTAFDVRIVVPPIPSEEIEASGRGKASLARVYNRLVRGAAGQSLFRYCGAFFRVTGRRR